MSRIVNTGGNPILYGSGVPGSGLGNDGDTYIDTDNDDIYGPKTGGAWGSPRGISTFFEEDSFGFRTKYNAGAANHVGFGGPSQASAARVYSFYGDNGTSVITFAGRSIYAFENGVKDNFDFRCEAAYFENDIIIDSEGVFKTNNNKPIILGDPLNIYWVTTVVKNALTGIVDGSILGDSNLGKIQLFENGAWRNVIQKEEDIVSTVLNPTIVSGAYTYPTNEARQYVFTVTQNTTLTPPTLDDDTSLVFSAIVDGNFTLTHPGVTIPPISDTYDGTVLNELNYKCYKLTGSAQVNILTITNLA